MRILNPSLVAALSLLPLSGWGETSSLPFGFAPPELTLSAFGTRNLQTGDFDQDGTLDLAVLNPGSGRVDLHIQKESEEKETEPVLHRERWQPQLSHPRFQRESLLLQHAPLAMVSGDFNQDGAEDLAVVNDQDRLEIYHGPMTAGWRPADILDIPAATGEPGSLLWDPQEQILVLLGERDLSEVSWNDESKRYTVTQLASLPQGERRRNLLLLDVDGNGQKDILYESGTSSFNLAVHLRGASGSALLLRPQIEPEAERFLPHPSSPTSVLALHKRSPTLLQFEFQPGRKTEATDLQIEYIPLGTRQTPDVLWADVNRDGLDDLLVIEKGQPELSWSQSGKDGSLTSKPSLPLPVSPGWVLEGTWSSTASGPQFLLHDPESKYLAITSYDKGRFRIPTALAHEETILRAAAWPSPENASDRIVGIIRDSQNLYHAVVWSLKEDLSALQEEQRIALEELKRDPSEIFRLPPDQDRPGLFLITNPLGTALMLQIGPDGQLNNMPPAKGFSSKLLERLKAQQIQALPSGVFPTPWVLFKGSTVLFLRTGEDGTLQVVDQLNLRERGEAVALLPLDRSAETVAVFDRTRNRFELHARDESGIYRYQSFVQVPPFQFQSATLSTPSDTGDMTLRMQGRTQCMVIHASSPRVEVTSKRLYESDLPKTRPTLLAVGDFNGDRSSDVVMVDAVANHTLELLQQKGDTWESNMHFALFETSPGAAGRRGGAREPREMVVVDVNGDGLDDLLMLIHDRILLYLQDPIPETP